MSADGMTQFYLPSPPPCWDKLGAKWPADSRVWRRPDTWAGRVALGVWWLVWLMTLGRAGRLPWKWVRRSRPEWKPPTGHVGGSASGRVAPVPPPNILHRWP